MAGEAPVLTALCRARARDAESFHQSRGQVPSKPQREFQGAVDRPFSRRPGSVIEVTLGVSILQIDRGRHHLVAERQDRRGQFYASSRSQQVPQSSLVARATEFTGMRPECVFYCRSLTTVIRGGCRPVQIDVVEVLGVELSLSESGGDQA